MADAQSTQIDPTFNYFRNRYRDTTELVENKLRERLSLRTLRSKPLYKLYS